ncbi:MAG TPA: universal stress protein [Anaerolineae bacterium]|nr:universal stress protein [Anaerolineae bacterium]
MKSTLKIRESVKQPTKTAAKSNSSSCFLVYYDGGASSAAALRYACQQADSRTQITAVYLAVVPHDQALDEKNERAAEDAYTVLAAAIANAKQLGKQIETKIVACRVKGPELVRLAKERGGVPIILGIDHAELDGKLNSFAEFVTALAPADVVLVAV